MANLSDYAAQYLASVEAEFPGLLAVPEGRRILTRVDPLLFALVYLPHHLSGNETGDLVSFSEAHLDWYEQMKSWVKAPTVPREYRRAYISPRASAKTTTWFLIAPLWAAAHTHVTFCAAFADSATQAEAHLTTFKAELETNALLRQDYPDLCSPMRRARGTTTFDSRNMTQQRNGFVFAARGVDSASLGMKVGEKRPDLLILDDIEPSESNYSLGQAEKRLSTIQQAILPLNEYARVVLVGTVTMEGSLVHQLAKTQTSTDDPAQWISDENWQTHYYPAILVNEDGTERSLWPQKWSLEFLQSIRHTRSFMLNYQNLPVAKDGQYWSTEDFVYEEAVAYPRTIISVDPAVTSKGTSDFTGISLISFDPSAKKMYIRESWKVKLSPAELRARVATIISEYAPQVLLVETNQGGDVWGTVFAGLPVKYREIKQSAPKHVRATWLLNSMQRGKTVLTQRLPELTSQLMGFPHALNDDMLDTCSSALIYFTGVGTTQSSQATARTKTYV